jgi:transmembrane sensor
MNPRDEHMDAAIAWTIRLKHGTPEDWRAFTDWLEADPAHLSAWEHVSLADDELGALPRHQARPAAATLAPSRGGGTPRKWMLGGGVAAVLSGVLAVTTLQSSATYALETGPGERRSVTLADGSRLDMNGGTRLVLDRDNPRFAKLERGEALFTVVHDESRPFEVHAGRAVLQDLGTVFDVVHESGQLRVAVAEGAVMYNPDGERVRLDPGMRLTDSGGDRVAVAQVDADTIAGWKAGRLSYSATPIATVAADLSRNVGVPVAVDRSIAGRPFTGVIVLDRDRELLFGRVAALLGVRAVRAGDGWTLTEGDTR